MMRKFNGGLAMQEADDKLKEALRKVSKMMMEVRRKCQKKEVNETGKMIEVIDAMNRIGSTLISEDKELKEREKRKRKNICDNLDGNRKKKFMKREEVRLAQKQKLERMKQIVFFDDGGSIQREFEHLIGYTGPPTWFC